jgi:hypothetical protein
MLNIRENPKCKLCPNYCHSTFCSQECYDTNTRQTLATSKENFSMGLLPKIRSSHRTRFHSTPLSVSLSEPRNLPSEVAKSSANAKGIFIYKKWVALEIIFTYE